MYGPEQTLNFGMHHTEQIKNWYGQSKNTQLLNEPDEAAVPI